VREAAIPTKTKIPMCHFVDDIGISPDQWSGIAGYSKSIQKGELPLREPE